MLLAHDEPLCAKGGESFVDVVDPSDGGDDELVRPRVAQDRERLEHSDRFGVELRQMSAEHRNEVAGSGQSTALGHRAQRGDRVFAQQGAEEKRTAAGVTPERIGELGSGGGVLRPHDSEARLLVEPVERDTEQRLGRLHDRIPLAMARPAGAMCGDDQHTIARHALQQDTERIDRFGVRPLQVVDEQSDGAAEMPFVDDLAQPARDPQSVEVIRRQVRLELSGHRERVGLIILPRRDTQYLAGRKVTRHPAGQGTLAVPRLARDIEHRRRAGRGRLDG
nr:hypothetical protein [Microbacterium sp. RU33B]